MVVKRTCNFTVLYWLSILLRVFITQNVCLSTMFVEVPGQSVLLACPELFNSPSIAPCFESQNLNGKTSNHGFRVLGFGVYGQSTRVFGSRALHVHLVQKCCHESRGFCLESPKLSGTEGKRLSIVGTACRFPVDEGRSSAFLRNSRCDVPLK